jgi:protein-arginine kinase activator protein McsA
MNDKELFNHKIGELLAIVIADALGIDLKQITMEVLEEKLKECEHNEEYEKCAVIRDKIKEIK